jgi:hypothetical protein
LRRFANATIHLPIRDQSRLIVSGIQPAFPTDRCQFFWGCTVHELDNQLQVSFRIVLSPEALSAARDPDGSAHAVVIFAFEDGEVQCDGEISPRLTIKI